MDLDALVKQKRRRRLRPKYNPNAMMDVMFTMYQPPRDPDKPPMPAFAPAPPVGPAPPPVGPPVPPAFTLPSLYREVDYKKVADQFQVLANLQQLRRTAGNSDEQFRQGGVASTSEARAEARARREEEEREFN